MANKMKETVYGTPTKNILAIPDHYVAIAATHDTATVSVPGLATLVDGKYIVKAGTFYPNATAPIGVVLNDYDVTDGACAMAVVVHGFVKVKALPVAPTDAQIAAMPQITFIQPLDENGKMSATNFGAALQAVIKA